MARCTHCLLRTRIPGIVFDAHGVCNVCNTWSACGSDFLDFQRLGQRFREITGEARGEHTFDAVVGVSGGKDSVFVLHKLVQYGLRVLAVVVDFGFMPNATALSNASRAIQLTGVDAVRLTVPRGVVKKLFHAWLSKPSVLTPCHACGRLLEAQLMKCAIENDAPLIATGFDRGQLFGKLHLPSRQLRAYRGIQMSETQVLHAEATSTIQWVEHMSSVAGVGSEESALILPKLSLNRVPGRIPRFLHYFLFHPYDEVAIKEEIIDAGLWTAPPNDGLRCHHDCELRVAVAYGAYATRAGDRLEFELSSDIREGRITAGVACRRLESGHAELANTRRPYRSYAEAFDIQERSMEWRTSLLRLLTPFHSFASRAALQCLGNEQLAERVVRCIRVH